MTYKQTTIDERIASALNGAAVSSATLTELIRDAEAALEEAADIADAEHANALDTMNRLPLLSFVAATRCSNSTRRPPVVRATATRVPIQVADFTNEASYKLDAAIAALVDLGGARTFLVVPMLKEDEVVGAIAIYRQEVRPFNDKQIELVQNFAAQAVIAIENARLLNELRHRTTELTEALEQQTATSEVLQVISRSPNDLEPVFASMLDNAVRICDAKFGGIFRWTKGALHLVATRNAPAGYAEARRRTPQQGDPMDRVLTTKSIVHIADLAGEASYVEGRIHKWLCPSSTEEYALSCSFLCCWRTNQSAYFLCFARRSDPSLTKRQVLLRTSRRKLS